MTNHTQYVKKADLTKNQVSIINQLHAVLSECLSWNGAIVTKKEVLGMVLASHGWEWDEFCKKFP